ncbi:MAG: DKNYY domain-containing protein [Crocinitomicaceae bacterium]
MKIQSYILNAAFIFLSTFTSCIDTNEEYEIPELEEVTTDSIEWLKLEESQKIGDYFILNEEVYCGEVAYNTFPLDGVDINSFEVLSNTKYAKDKNKVYYPLLTVCVDGENWGNCHAVEYIMDGTDPNSFEFLDKDYTKDKNHIYWRGKIVKEADPATFHMVIKEFDTTALDSRNSFSNGRITQDY